MRETAVERQLQDLDRGTLTGLVRLALNSETVELREWEFRALTESAGIATGGVYRVAGSGQDRGEIVAWSLVLKVVSTIGAGLQLSERSDPGHPLYWKREALAYQSGLLDDLPGGITAPRCYAIVEQSGEAVWLWLEDVQEEYGPRWPQVQFQRAARCLGRFNGAYLAGERPMPRQDWLCRTASPRGLLNNFTWVHDLICEPATWEHPRLRAAFPLPVAERLACLWADRERLLSALDRLPHSLCHLDAWRRNLFAPGDGLQERELIAIDWSYLGKGAVATDAGDLVGASFSMRGTETSDPRALGATVLEEYLQGLREAGWHGDARIVQFGFAAFTALKYGCLLPWLRDALDEDRVRFWEHLAGCTMDEFLQTQAALVYYLLDMADDAHRLAGTLRLHQ